MISVNQALSIHEILVERYGGAQGIRDTSALESALARPFSTFDGIDLYESVFEKAAALIESILINHPFMDGNKRTGYAIMQLVLMSESFYVQQTMSVQYNFVISIASGQLKYEGIVEWLKTNATPL